MEIFSSPIIFLLLRFLLLVSLICPIYSSNTRSHQLVNQTFLQEKKFQELKKRIASYLKEINKPAVKTIHSPDGDIIDCVRSHEQHAFDHPLLKEHKILDPPKSSRSNHEKSNMSDYFQLWHLSGESCPERTIPIRRTTEQDLLRADSINTFGRKLNNFRRDSNGNNGHESLVLNRESPNCGTFTPTTISTLDLHAIGYVSDGKFYGGRASINVWSPKVEIEDEFSLAQIWIVSGTFGEDLTTIEAGWQVYPRFYGDNQPRLFIYWTTDSYRRTGCYNLLCSAFVQTSSKVVIGAAIPSASTYNGRQLSITFSVWKDPNNGNWWLEFGAGNKIGYWPSSLVPLLKDYAQEVHFGGEVLNRKSGGSHTSTQMGSGHFAEANFRKAAYFRNCEVVDYNHNFISLPNPKFLEESPNCYNIKDGFSEGWGSHFYFGGPGRNNNCS